MFLGDEVVLRDRRQETAVPPQNWQPPEGSTAQQVKPTVSSAVARRSTHKLTDVEAKGRVPSQPADVAPADRFEPPPKPVIARPVEPEAPVSTRPAEPEMPEPTEPAAARPEAPVPP